MVKQIILPVLALVLVTCLSLPALGAEGDNGTIEGQLVNGTTGGSSASDIEVQLKTYVSNQETGTPLTTKSGSDGRFTFNNLSTSQNNTYQVTLAYQGVEYLSDIITFGQGETSKSANITVYDTTNTDEAINISAAHTIISLGEGNLQVVVVFDITNDTDRVYVGAGNMTTGERRVLTFSLPAEATEIQYDEGLVPSHEGLVDTRPVFPGGIEIVYAYKVPYKGGTYKFQQKLNYPVDWFNVLAQKGIKVASDQLIDQGPVDMGNVTYTYSGIHNVGRGETVSATLSGPISLKTIIIWVAAALLLMAVSSGLAYWRIKNKHKAQPVRVESFSKEQDDLRERKLLAELAKLDDDFDAGRIQEEAYRAQRAAKKAQLVKLMSGSKEATGVDD